MSVKQISNLDIDPALNDIERVNMGIAFLAQALPVYPHEGGLNEINIILECLSDRTKKAIENIRVVAKLD